MAITGVGLQVTSFDAPDLWTALEKLYVEPERYDALDFGLVAMDADGVVTAYNTQESQLAGIPPASALGLNFFTDVAPCTNNYLVAGRFEDAARLDETINYVFTVKMRPTRVRLRLLKDNTASRQYLAVQWV